MCYFEIDMLINYKINCNISVALYYIFRRFKIKIFYFFFCFTAYIYPSFRFSNDNLIQFFFYLQPHYFSRILIVVDFCLFSRTIVPKRIVRLPDF